MWALVVVVAYLFASRVSVALAIAFLVPILALGVWMIRRIRQVSRRKV
jgi:hypothetical protein